ncbi:helix-turn-helix domain-containing protein [Isoptericola aurantiacus]|uniref:helix-turn-helix domain-containing protein n=1 Tax=Isoptericola aurantiacus TaxID=3377839 RepID=UPI00383AB163
MHHIDQAIGDEVRAARHRRRQRQADLARLLDITPMTFSRKETGKVPFTARELSVIAETLHLPVADLYPNHVPTPAA